MLGACSAAEEEEEESTLSRNRCGDGDGFDGAFVEDMCMHMLPP